MFEVLNFQASEGIQLKVEVNIPPPHDPVICKNCRRWDASLPSVPDFAECFLSGARQRGYLSSAREKTLDKQLALGKQ